MDIRFWISTTTQCTVGKWNSEVAHEPWAKLYVVGAGQARYAVRRPGASWQACDLVPGRIYLIPGGCAHRNSCKAAFTLHWCHVTVDAELEARLAALPGIVGWPLTDFGEGVAAVVAGAAHGARLRAGALLLTLLDRLPDPAPDALASERAQVAPATGLLDYRFTTDHRIADLAARCGLRPTRFQQLFRLVHGMTPGDYLAHLRLAEARRLLATTTLGVGEVGEQVGWANPFHFSRIFRRHLNCSPRAWRADCNHRI